MLAVPFPACELGAPSAVSLTPSKRSGAGPPVDTPCEGGSNPCCLKPPRCGGGDCRGIRVTLTDARADHWRGTEQCGGRAGEGEPLHVLGGVRDRLEQLCLASGGPVGRGGSGPSR